MYLFGILNQMAEREGGLTLHIDLMSDVSSTNKVVVVMPLAKSQREIKLIIACWI